jgi:Flp pilus assembly protein TadD
MVLARMGRTEQALRHARRAAELEPADSAKAEFYRKLAGSDPLNR